MRPRTHILRLTAHLLLCLALAAGCRKSSNESVWIHVLDVGYGDSVLIRFEDGKALMIDAGTRETSNEILDSLKQFGITELDALFLTHAHENHYGAAEKMLSSGIEIKQLYLSAERNAPESFGAFLGEFEKRKIPRKELRRGDAIRYGRQVSINILNPKEITGDPHLDALVLLLRHGRAAFLFPSDIKPEIQRALVEKHILRKKPNALLLPHHGDVLDPAFREFVSSSLKIASTGPSRWGPSPHPETLKTFSNDPLFLRTDLEGTLIFKSNGHAIRRETGVIE